jgi:hypothetical protein
MTRAGLAAQLRSTAAIQPAMAVKGPVRLSLTAPFTSGMWDHSHLLGGQPKPQATGSADSIVQLCTAVAAC